MSNSSGSRKEEHSTTTGPSVHRTVAVLHLSREGIVRQADPAAIDLMHNLRQTDVIGKPLTGLLSEQNAAGIRALLDGALAGTGQSARLPVPVQDGPAVWLDVTLLPSGTETVLCSLYAHSPVPLPDAQHDAVKSQALTVLDTISKGVQVMSPDGRLIYQNAAAEAMLGLPITALVTKRAHDILHHSHPDGSPYALEDCPIFKTLEDGQPRHVVDEVFFRGDGTAFPVEYSVLPVPKTDRPAEIGAILSFRDVTDRKLDDALRLIEPDILDLLSNPDTRAQGLDQVTTTVDRMLPGFRSQIMIVAADATLRTGSAPGLPEALRAAQDGIAPAEGMGSASAAVLRKTTVVTPDISRDPLWRDLGPLALHHGLHACFATPVIGLRGEVQASFALYADQVGPPSAQIAAIMSRVALFLRNLLDRSEQSHALHESEARYEEIFNLVPVSIWEYDATEEIAMLRGLQAQGVTDLAAYLTDNPGFLEQAFAHHKVTQVNDRALSLYKAGSFEELVEGFKNAADSNDFRIAYRDYLLALASGKPHFVTSGTMYRLDGSAFRILTEMHMPQGDSTRVLMAELDITDQEIAERRFRSIVQTSSSAVFDRDHRTDTIWWSEGLRTAFGHDPKAMAATTTKWAEMVHPDDLERTMEVVRQANSPPYRMAVANYRFRRADGNYAHVEVRAQVILDNAGKPERSVGSLVDVTDRVMAEERFRIVAENSSDVVFENNWATDQMWWSDGFRTAFGHDPATAAHTLSAFLDLVHPDDRTELWETIVDWRSRPDSLLRAEFRLRRADFTYADVDVHARRAFDAQNTSTRVVGALVDISKRKAIEERLQMAVKVTSDVVWDQDLKTKAIWWSDALLDKLGIDPASLAPDPLVWHETIHPDDRDRVRQSYVEAVMGGTDTWSQEYRLRRADGSYITIRDTARILRDRSGLAYRAVGAIVDLTQTRLLEEQLQRARRLETIGQLTGGIAHDFNNLLAIVMGSADLLLARLPATGEDHDLATMILEASERGAALTERLLAFARKQSLSPRMTVPCDVILGLKPMLQRTLGPQVILTLDLAAPSQVMLDVAQFENALINLCVNARDAMPEGGTLTISAWPVVLGDEDRAMLPELAGDSYLMVTVSDSGLGMSEATLSHVFEPFFTTKGVGKGTGLGLSSVHGFVRQSGGAIRVHSKLGKGTSVQMYFPVNPVAATPPSPDPQSALAADPETNLPALHSHVLVVDDDDLLRVQTRQSLTLLGCQVTEAASGAQALEVLATTKGIDLVLSDIVMRGGMDGKQLAGQIRALYPSLPILLTTGYSKGLTDDPALPPILFKPYRLNDLKQRISLAMRP